MDSQEYEITKTNDVDYAITIREFIKWLNEKNNFRKVEGSKFNYFTVTSLGVIFGSSGLVTETMIRYVYHKKLVEILLKNYLTFLKYEDLTTLKKQQLR